MAGLVPNFMKMAASGADDTPDSGAEKPKTASIIRISGDEVTIEEPGEAETPVKSKRFDENLAERISEGDLSALASRLLLEIDDDKRARQGFDDNYIKGLAYLGLTLANAPSTRGRRSTSKVYHPALQWACVKFQSGARAELLPAGGPCKVWNIGEETAENSEIADDLEQDLNWYLTTGAPEYYPDTDRAFYYLAFGGTFYKKVYRCPLRQRPVSDSVYVTELVVSPEAASLDVAQRITHDIGDMTEDDLTRMMVAGIYREVPLSQPVVDDNELRKVERGMMGVRNDQQRSEDSTYRIFECYTYLDLSQYGIVQPGQGKSIALKLSGNSSRPPLPYKVTIERDSQRILEIRRNWRQGDRLFRRKPVFVEYALIPGMGGLNYGYLHLLGNTEQALTALLRLVIDAGMFSNFPGGVRSKGARADTNELNPAPGEFVAVDVPALEDIRKSIMAMPYKEPSQTLLLLIEYLEKQIQMGIGAIEMGVGEGKTHIPVGTMLAMIEQQTQNMAAVHKRMHSAQARELNLLKDLFAEYPEDLVEMEAISGRLWSREMFANVSLVPASDPNIPSQAHRLMLDAALLQLKQAFGPKLQDDPILRRALRGLGISDTQNYINPNPTPPVDPKAQAAQAEAQVKQMSMAVQARQQDQQMQKQALEGQIRMRELGLEAQDNDKDRQLRRELAQAKLTAEAMKINAANKAHIGEGLQPRGFADGGSVAAFAIGGITNVEVDRMGEAIAAMQHSGISAEHVVEEIQKASQAIENSLLRLRKKRVLVRDVNGRASHVKEVENE